MKKVAGILFYVLGTFFLGMAFVPASHAATYTVTGTADGTGACDTVAFTCPTLRAAITQTNVSAGADIITLSAGVYSLTVSGKNENLSATGDLDISDDLTINGAAGCAYASSPATCSIIEAVSPFDDRLLHVKNPATATTDITVSLTNVVLRGANAIDINGGGIFNESGAVTLTSSIITNNHVSNPSLAVDTGNGGGIYNLGTLNLNGSEVSNNSAYNNKGPTGGGGGIYNMGPLTATASTITGNLGIPDGGGIYNAGSLGQFLIAQPMVLQSSTISNNTAGVANNTLAGSPDTAAEVPGTCGTISSGGAAAVPGSGGGIANLFGKFSMERSTVSGNCAYQSGGGAVNFGGTFLIARSTVKNNTSVFNGGGVTSYANTDIVESAVHNNTSRSGNGGGIYNLGNGALSLVNSTVTLNSAAYNGGGVYNARQATLVNSTIYNDTATYTGNEFFGCENEDAATHTCPGGATKLQSDFTNTIVSNPVTTAPVCAGDLTTTMHSHGNNIESQNTCLFTVPVTTTGSDHPNTDPMLGVLTTDVLINSPANPPYYPLLAGSPAIDAGLQGGCPLNDQRNYKRDPAPVPPATTPACDIGAFEISTTSLIGNLANLKMAMSQRLTLGHTQYQLELTYEIANEGPNTATNMVFTATLSPDVAFGYVQSTNTAFKNSCTANPATHIAGQATTVTCSLASLPAYDGVALFILTYPQIEFVTVYNSGSVTSNGTGTAPDIDPYTPDNTATLSTPITPQAAGLPVPSGTNFTNSQGRPGLAAIGPWPLLILGAWTVYISLRRTRRAAIN